MKAYAIGLLREVKINEDIVNYVKGMDATLEPYNGRFIIQGAKPDFKEGNFEADVIVIEFPDRARANAWYNSAAYQQIVGLRKANARGEVLIVEGVSDDHKAIDILPHLSY